MYPMYFFYFADELSWWLASLKVYLNRVIKHAFLYQKLNHQLMSM